MRATCLPAIWLTNLAVGLSGLAVGLSGCGEATAPDGDRAAAGGTAIAAAAEPAAEQDGARDQPATAAPHAGPANRLAGETSPYLLMHARNPVDWYPWGPEALARAKAEQKLIFLSIGYSSCYWCHVMERESFLDAQIAAFLNKHFVCIKVDREERPDIDEIYMAALQAMSGRGGWPLSMFLTPDALPIVGGTYFPPRGREGMPGFLDVLRNVQTAWQGQRPKVLEQGRQLAAVVRQNLKQRPVVAGKLDASVLDDVRTTLDETFDARYGGFGYAPQNPRRPKFPEPSNLVFLLDRARRNPDDARAKEMLQVTLEKMARGGIYDHLGGGFHRYSTDRFWRVPHFEKMLYDNGQLLSVYAEAYALTGQEEFRRTAVGIARFVLDEMTGPEGGFYTALDAETDAHEGKFYIWSGDELRAELPGADFARLSGAYGGGGEANFEGQHVLQLARPLAELARAAGVSEGELDGQLAPLRGRLLAKRNERKRPLTDTKILTGWNGLMIGGLADAGRILEEPRYIAAAEKSARCVLSHLRTADGRLQRTWGGGKARLNGYLDDYAFLTSGLLALHRATGKAEWLKAADGVTAKQIELFADEQNGGFFFTSHDHEALLARSKDPVDGALPAGNSVSAENLLILAEQLERPAYRQQAEQTLRATLPLLTRAPAAAPRMATALARFLASGAPAPAASEKPAPAEAAAPE